MRRILKNRLDYITVLLKSQKYLSDGILVFDAKLEGIPLIFVNKSVRRILGYPNKDLIGKSWKFLINPNSTTKNLEKLKLCFSNMHNATCDLILEKKDGTKIYTRISISPIPDSNSQTDFFLCVLRDITCAREALKKQLQLETCKATLHSVNDIVLNFFNTVRVYRMDMEDLCQFPADRLSEFDREYMHALNEIKKMNELNDYKEVQIAKRFAMISTLN